MPRSRMIKPEFWDDQKLATISRDARLVYIALWNFSDDYGVVKGHPVWLKTRIFPYDEAMSLAAFTVWLKELEKSQRILRFEHDGELYYWMPKFEHHQTICRPSKFKNPRPPVSVLNTQRTLNECDISTQDPLKDETETETETKNKVTASGGAGRNGRSGHFEKIIEEKYLAGIVDHCMTIQKLPPHNGHRFNPYEWVQKMANQGRHPGAVEQVLYSMSRLSTWRGIRGSPWRWAAGTMKIVEGNFNEADHRAEAEAFKGMDVPAALKSVLMGIGKNISDGEKQPWNSSKSETAADPK